MNHNIIVVTIIIITIQTYWLNVWLAPCKIIYNKIMNAIHSSLMWITANNTSIFSIQISNWTLNACPKCNGTARIRTIHQISMVPVKRSEFSGNSSMSLPIITANLRPAAIRRVSVKTHHSHKNITHCQLLFILKLKDGKKIIRLGPYWAHITACMHEWTGKFKTKQNLCPAYCMGRGLIMFKMFAQFISI